MLTPGFDQSRAFASRCSKPATRKKEMNVRPVLCAAAVAFSGLAASAESGLRIGVQAGIEQWEMDLGVPLTNDTGVLDPDFGLSFSVLGQYLFDVDAGGDGNFFVGFEGAATVENVDHSQPFSVVGVPITANGKIPWSLDALWLMGYDFGQVTAFISGGGSYAAGELVVEGSGLTATDENLHLGWKFAPGVEIELSETSSLMLRVNYGLYQSKKYTGALPLTMGDPINVDVDFEPRVFDLRVAWVHRFDTLSGR